MKKYDRAVLKAKKAHLENIAAYHKYLIEYRGLNISNIFICVCNDQHVGLFKRIDWVSKIEYTPIPRYASGSIYVGVNSGYIGVNLTHSDTCTMNLWCPSGTKVFLPDRTYIANCNIENAMSFDDMRLIMHDVGEIKNYEIGKASLKEVFEVLQYASSYY